jgi:hypothetical protein
VIATIVASSGAQGLLVYMNFLNWPPNINSPRTAAPDTFGDLVDGFSAWVEDKPGGGNSRMYAGIMNASVRTISTQIDRKQINGWYIAPTTQTRSAGSKTIKTVLYLHGNGGNRATGHRVELYQVSDCHACIKC